MVDHPKGIKIIRVTKNESIQIRRYYDNEYRMCLRGFVPTSQELVVVDWSMWELHLGPPINESQSKVL